MKPIRHLSASAIIIIICTAAASGFFLPPQAHADDAADAIVKQVEDSLKPPKSFSVLSTIDTYRNRVASGTILLRTYVNIADSNQGPRSVSIVLTPQGERGKVFLRIDDAFWLYDPGARRPVRLSTQQRLMGDASLADVTHFDLVDNYSADLETEEVIADASGKSINGQRLKLTALSKTSLYPTLRLWVDKSDRQPVKVECLSSTGSVLKTVYYGRFRGFLGKQRPTELMVIDGTAAGRVTRIRFSEFLYQDLQAEAYTPEAMPSVSKFADSDSAAGDK